jgi:glycyl-tRNA synthetase beta chain
MLPYFIVVSNTAVENNDTVRKGAERVLKARLEDARFYYKEDQEIPLWDYVEKLKKVTFQEKLGTLYQKAERISSLCSFIVDELSLPSKEIFLRAAMLCKADLVTGIVGEFPELQGYMGMIYALNSGEDKEVASAVYEHYLPKFSGDSLPSDETGAVVSLADKMDNIASFFFLGLIPTGSEDPFALKRQATGIINILQSSDYPLSLDMLIEKSLQNLNVSSKEKKTLSDKILQFFYQRLEGIFLTQKYSYDIINAVLATKELNINELNNRIAVLSGLRKYPGFPGLLTAAKRVYNILAKVQPGEVKENLLAESAERELYDVVGTIKDNLTATDFEVLFKLEKPINTLFDNVLVMDKNPEIKQNRLALLLSVKKAFDSLGDFSKIVE